MEAFHLQVVEGCPLPHPLLASAVAGPCLVLPKDIALAALEPFEIVADNRLPAASDSNLETFLVCKIDDKIIALKYFCQKSMAAWFKNKSHHCSDAELPSNQFSEYTQTSQ